MASKQDANRQQLHDHHIIQQYAKDVVDFSSQYGSETSISYTACNLSGKSNIYPGYGDFTQACVFRTYGTWWKQTPSACRPYRKTPTSYCSVDFIELSFEYKVHPIRVDIYETYHPGAVVKIMAYDASAGTDVDTGQETWVTLWSDQPSNVEQRPRVFSPPLSIINFATDLIRLELCHDRLQYYTELDAVILQGLAEMSMYRSWAVTNKTLTESLERLELRDIPKKETKNINWSPVLNGYFDCLPEEVIQLILSYLDIPSLCRLAQTCKLLRQHCYDPLLYTEVDLQPHWPQTSDEVLDHLQGRCHMIQRLNLSWCGKNGPLSTSACDRFFSVCGETLSCLGLSCCQFVTGDYLELIAEHCPNLTDLNLSGCRKIDGLGMIELTKLTKLQKLNLYRTFIELTPLLNIIYSCPDLQHLNIGSCSRISSHDDIATALGNYSKKLKSLDLWRSRKISYIGLQTIANNCPNLEELDIGWCSDLHSSTGCLVNLVEKCCKLRKIFLTANRMKIALETGPQQTRFQVNFTLQDMTVCDTDILAMAKNLPNLEQLDILGTREVTADAAVRVLEQCKKLTFFDVSFCAGLDITTVETWRRAYPNVDIKKSFQS